MEMILRLLLIFYLSSFGCSFEVKIEKDRCGKDTTCFIRKSCIEGNTDGTVLVRYESEKLKDGNCDVFMQIRPYSSSKMHVMIEVTSTTGAIKSEGVALVQGQEQFRCSDGKETTSNQELIIKSYGDRHPADQNKIFCSFTLETKNPALMFQNLMANNGKVPEILFTTDQTNIVKYILNKDVMWREAVKGTTCDPGAIITSDNSDEMHISEMVDNTRPVIECSKFGSLRIQRDDNTIDYPKRLICNSDFQWTYEKEIGGQTQEQIIRTLGNLDETVIVHCVAKFCSLCAELDQFPSCHDCTPATYSNTGECATSTCANDFWRISNGEPDTGKMECKKKRGSSREAAWYLSTDENKPISAASCAKNADCWNLAEFDTTCPPKQSACPPLQITTENITCRDTHQLLYVLESQQEEVETNKMTCDVITGQYEDDMGAEVSQQSRVYCGAPRKTTTIEPQETTQIAAGKINMQYVGAGIVGLIVISALLFVGVIFIRRQVFKVRDKKRKEFEVKEKARLAAILVSVNPTECLPKRVLLPEKEKTEWEKRTRHSPDDLEEPEPELLEKWNNQKFPVIMSRFPKLTPAGRIAVLQTLTAFDAYSLDNIDADQDSAKQFGNLKQFFSLWQQSTKDMLDCHVTWEFMWRMMRILYDNFITHDDHREIGKKMLTLIVSWARPMLTELTFRMRAGEEECDTHLRCLAVRMLLWTDAPDVKREIERQANLPVHQVQSPLRYVVYSYACRDLNKAEEFKNKNWSLVQADKPEFRSEIYGSLKQHILYACCAARDESKKDTDQEFKILKETINEIFDYQHMRYSEAAFTPADQVWAMRGAAEFTTNMKLAVDLFIGLVPTEPDAVLHRCMMFRCNQDRNLVHAMKAEWRGYLLALLNVVAEMCTIQRQFLEFQAATSPLVFYLTTEDNNAPFPLLQFQKRSVNVYNLIFDRNCADLFFKALNAIM